MNEQTELEDREMVEAVQRTIPTVDTAYRAELRRRLAAMPEPKRRFAIGLRWPALSGAAAAVALILVLLNPFGQRSATPVSAKTLLERVAQTAAHPGPYMATAMISTSGGGVGGSSLPLGLERVTSDSTLFATYAVRDATHWRVELHTVRPALEAGTMTMAANGRSVVTYWSISRLAVSTPEIPGVITPGFGAAFSMAGTIGTLVAAMNHPQSGHHARLVGERTILGRAAYLVRVWPAGRSSTGPCTGVKNCLRKSHAYGYDLLWIDKEHLTALRYEQRGSLSHVQRLLYRVTSITYGKGPTPAQLAYRPPVPVKQAGNGPSFSDSGGSAWGERGATGIHRRRSWGWPLREMGRGMRSCRRTRSSRGSRG